MTERRMRAESSLVEDQRPVNRVLMLTQYLGIGGLERMIFNLSLGLKELGTWEPFIFAYDGSYQDRMASMHTQFENHGIPVELFRKEAGFSWATVDKIARFVQKHRIQAIHSHDLGALIYAVLSKIRLFGRVRVIHTQHSFVHLARYRRYRLYEKLFTRFADQLIVVSPDTRARYVELGVRSSRIQIIENGVEFSLQPVRDRNERLAIRRSAIDRFCSVQERTAELKDSLERVQDAFWILYLARVHGGKGQLEALDLWNALSSEVRRQSALIFVGPDTQPGALDSLRTKMKSAFDSNRIIYAGATELPRQWIDVSDSFLSSSTFEGMPLAPYEAAGSGLPVILSDIAGHEGLRSFADLYPLSSPERGAQAVAQVIERYQKEFQYYSELLWNRSQSIRKRLSIRSMSKRYAKAYGSS